MCLGIPMQVMRVKEQVAQCRNGDEQEMIDISLVARPLAGDWLLVHLGSARQSLSDEDARQIRDALDAVSLVMQGGKDVDHLFADLVDRQPALPPHLQTELDSAANVSRPEEA